MSSRGRPPSLRRRNAVNERPDLTNILPSGGSATNNSSAGTLFGSNPAASQAGGGLFGNKTATPAPTGGLFGNAGAASAAPAAGNTTSSLFGAPAANTQASAAPSLFGGQAATVGTSAPSLFGASATAQPATGGLFGGLNNAQSKPATGGLFGAAPAASQPQTTSLFGGSLGAPAQKPATGGLFGGASQTQTNATPSLFGAANPASAAPSTSLFGSTLNKPAAPANTSLFGTSTAAPAGQITQQGGVQAVTIDWANVKPTTRFNELHPSVQEQLCMLDDAIQLQINQSTQINEFMPRHGDTVSSLPGDAAYLEQRLEAVQGAIDSDVRSTERAKQLTTSVISDARITFGAIENLRLPSQFHYMPGQLDSSSMAKQRAVGGALAAAGIRLEDSDEQTGSTRDLLAYFRQKVEDLSARLEVYSRQVREVEEHISTVEVSAVEQIQRAMIRRQQASRMGITDGSSGDANGEASAAVLEFKKERLRELAGALKGLEDAILRVAGRVGETREGVVECQFPERNLGSQGNGGGFGGGWR